MNTSNGQRKPQELSPKLKQFVEELNVLQDKYQYQLTPILEVTPRGIIPAMKVIDKIPPKTQPDKPPEVKPEETKSEVPSAATPVEAKKETN